MKDKDGNSIPLPANLAGRVERQKEARKVAREAKVAADARRAAAGSKPTRSSGSTARRSGGNTGEEG